MGISINSTSLDPQNITPPRVKLSVTYNGLVDSDADNPVTITMTLEDNTKVYIADNATDTKNTLTWTDSLPVGNAGDKTKTGLYVGIEPPDPGNNCNVAFHFKTAGGDTDDTQTHFNLQ